MLELVICFGDFGEYCWFLSVTIFLGDWGIVNAIVMWGNGDDF
jgi:hypothetical protein